MGARERGATFVSELIALAIIGAVIMILLSGISTAGAGVVAIREHITTENYARLQLEAIKAAPYRVNPTAEPYPTIAVPSHYTVTVDVRYWVSPTFTTTVPSEEEDQGLQEITIVVYSARSPFEPAFQLQGYKGNRP
ncbi:MAG: hypothetical protein H5T66_09295 [Chloroflexi bacterium]|nr:hypothetical protein [Chloroflexota bacterium]